ncbi:MAG: NADH-quinone oxidoreductase subunit NuoE [Desulfobacterales bacterium]|nr:NADH-quinone oxidoreductase subunit NuoE [Desulfobacterales bacterium]
MEKETVKERLTEILALCERDRSRLIPILQSVQDAFGYLPREAILEVASYLGMTDVQVYGVASFYNLFRFTPLGKHPIQMCMGTACHVVGGGLVLEALERVLDIEVGGITEDGELSLDRVACIGCCGLAPVMVIGKKIYPKMTPTKVDEALVNLKIETKEAARD